MPKNNYFNFNDKRNQNEIKLYEGINQEFNQITGVVIYYYPKNVISKDVIFQESIKKFDKFYEIPATFNNYESFDGNDLYSKFGLFMQRGIEFEISIKEFNDCVNGELDNPEIGDFVYLKNLNEWLEITHVNDKKLLLPFGTKFIYSFTAKKVEYEDEVIESSEDVEIANNFSITIDRMEYVVDEIEDDVDDFINTMSLIVDNRSPYGNY